MSHRAEVFLLTAMALFFCAGFITPAISQPVGTEFPVNTTTTGDQTLPDVAINATGYFIVVWESSGQDGSELGVFGQRFDPAGVKLGPEFQVNTYTDNNQARPAVALRNDGSFVVAWESRGQDGDGNGIFARLFDASGTPVAPEFQVNTYTFSNESAPDVSVDAGGNFAVAWQSTQQDGSSDASMVRRYAPDGTPLTPEVMANVHTYGFQGVPGIGCAANGDMVTAYASWELDGNDYAVGARRIHSTGGPIGDELLINQYSTSHQDYPDIAVVPDGRFIVAWHSAQQDGSGYGVYARRYNADGTRTGPEFQINEYTLSNQSWARVAADHFGGFTVVWQSFGQDGSRNGVYGHRYQWDGTPEGNLFRGNTTRTGDQEQPSVASDPDGNLVVVWQSKDQDGSGYGVYARRVASPSVPVTFADVAAVADGRAVIVRWRTNEEEPVAGYDLYRSSNGRDRRIASMLPPGSGTWRDEAVEPGTHEYFVSAIAPDGSEVRSRRVSVTVLPVDRLTLSNHPNPFNPVTSVHFEIPAPARVALDVYAADGSHVVTLFEGTLPAGAHQAAWNGTDASGQRVGSGVYLCRLAAGKQTTTRKLLLLK